MARILLVDDDIAEISAVKRVLVRAGHQAVLATNASDALAVVAQATPALALVAAACEGGEALALAHRLASGDGAPPVPLILLGHAEGIPEGAAQLARPVDPGQLAQEVTAALARAIAAAPDPTRAAAQPPGAVRGNGTAAVAVRRTGAASSAPKPTASSAPKPTASPAPKPTASPAPKPTASPEASGTPTAVHPERSVSAPAETRSRGTTSTATPTGPVEAAHPEPSEAASAAERSRRTRSSPAAPGGADVRHAAAEALRARADELRRTSPPATVPASTDAEDDGFEALLRRAEEAERLHLAERKARARQADRATVEAAQRAEAEKIAVEKSARAREAEARAHVEERARADAEALRREEEARRAEAEARAAAEAARRAEAEARARRDAEAAQRAAAEATRRAEVEKRAAAEAARRAEAERRDAEDAARRAEAERQEAEQTARRAEAEKRAAAEAARRAEADKREAEERARREAEDEAQRARAAEEKAAGEADARRRLEAELERLRVQLDEERRAAEQRIQGVLERAAAEEQAAEELRRIADDEMRREAEEAERRREEEEENLRRAIESARTEMEALRRRTDEEARRREEAETELRRIAEEAAREPVAFPFPDDVAIATRPAPAEASEDAARRRVAALRGRELDEAPAPPSTAAWLGAVIPDLEEHQRGAAIDRLAAHPERSDATGGVKSRDASAAERSRGTPPELRSGTLSDLPAPRLLALAARAKVSGRIDFQGEAARSLYLEDGRVVGATSGDPSDRVEELALRFGLLTRDQHRQLAAAAASLPSRRAALLLLERGFLKPTELTGLVRRRAEEVVFGLFAEPAARFRWVGAAVPPEERIALERGPLALAVEGVRRRWLAARVDDVLGGPGTLLVPGEGGPPVADLGLSAEERRAVALADGLRTLDEIVAASPLDALSTRQVLAALVLVDALRVRLLQGGRPAAAATAAIDLARVREKLDQARRADYFTILGIGRLCTPHEAREAAERLTAEFSPARFIGLREDALPAALDEILRVVADAREVLADDRLRTEYLGGLGE